MVLGFLAVVFLWFLVYKRRTRKENEDFAFFSDLDGEKFNLKLPAAVDEYYEVREQCEEKGWEPGKPPANQAEAVNGPHRILAQALMKRCIADIPLVTHIQKESAGMNKLYAQSMCSVKQWKTYQAAEAMVSAEVEEVRAEADEIEPGWSQVIWKQAMQYHNMLKHRHEMEAKQLAALAQKKAEEEAKKKAELNKEEAEKQKIADAEKAAEELIKQEEREKASKEAFSSKNGGMKKGFLSSSSKK
jgi:flagellar biosynthesis GTPase FlhF